MQKVPVLLFLIALTICIVPISCKDKNTKATKTENLNPEIKFSLAQWSYNRELFDGKMNTFDFIKEAKSLGFDGVEYVNQFFKEKVDDFEYLDSLKQISSASGITNVMIMIDREGDLGDSDEGKRKDAVDNHKKWVDAAAYIDCNFIRVNAHGDGTAEEMKNACSESIIRLADYAANKDIHILIENHGGFSSDASWLLALLDQINHKNVSLLADFDNWCIEREDGKLWGSPCIKEYDRQKGMRELLPHSKGISIKSFDFDKDGYESKMDYPALFKIMKQSKYNDFFAIEYEGHNLDSRTGVQKTKALADKMIDELY